MTTGATTKDATLTRPYWGGREQSRGLSALCKIRTAWYLHQQRRTSLAEKQKIEKGGLPRGLDVSGSVEEDDVKRARSLVNQVKTESAEEAPTVECDRTLLLQ